MLTRDTPVAITYLQHTDPSLPHYTEEEWNFVRGASATIDREFGFIGRHLLHGIIETHVLHHYVSSIPFYNADEATEAIKPVRPGRCQGQPPGQLASQGITNLPSQLARMGIASAEGHPRKGLELRRWHHEGITGGPSGQRALGARRSKGSWQRSGELPRTTIKAIPTS